MKSEARYFWKFTVLSELKTEIKQCYQHGYLKRQKTTKFNCIQGKKEDNFLIFTPDQGNIFLLMIYRIDKCFIRLFKIWNENTRLKLEKTERTVKL